jgi:phospholipase/carboxylesterase
MNNHLSTDLDYELRPARGEPAGALVLMHGRGADERDLLPLLDLFDPQRRLVGITPGGPLALPPGGRHWYVVPRVGYPEPQSFHASFEQLAGLVDAIPAAFGVPPQRIVLGGFSQGTVMSYALGLGAGRPAPAGIIALSGFIPTVEGWRPELEPRRAMPVWISHGRRDPVISVEFARAARDVLTAGGLDVTYEETESAHHVDPRAVAALPAWTEAAIERGAHTE